jgi:hypothetical protein
VGGNDVSCSRPSVFGVDEYCFAPACVQCGDEAQIDSAYCGEGCRSEAIDEDVAWRWTEEAKERCL